ncbi:MAG: response regulator transcription factor [Chloroflexi bacterium]|jgi:DNA-binding response OmpR family regulator|nr:response regulator transcription factor [Chloroflexota bacterium]
MVDRYRLLLVDDDVQLLAYLGDRLQRDGYDVTTAKSGGEALVALDAAWPDLVILDLMMPRMSGEELAAQIKRRADIPIIVLSAISAAESKVDLISRYAEDYLTKPFHHEELVARIRRVLGRLNERIPSQELVLGPDLTLVLRRREAIVDGDVVGLSPTETRFLATLAANVGESVTTERLLARVWSDADGADPAYVWVTVRRLRRKIERDPDRPRYLVTEKGGGYRLVGAG